MNLTQRMDQRLAQQKALGLYRSPPAIAARNGRFIEIGRRRMLNFASNDYLGFGNDEHLAAVVAQNFQKYGASGSSSRLVSGYYSAIREAEAALAEYFGYDSALIYPSGYQCNLGVIATLFEKGDPVFGDKHIHASSVAALKLSGARFYGYKHNDMGHLQKRLDRLPAPPAGLLTESLFSMDGDGLPVDRLLRTKQAYNLTVLVDEAHAFGVLGPKGRGMARRVADIAVGTFGKALGLFGAFALLPEKVREYLINFSSPLIYTTTLPEAHGASILTILKFIAAADHRREALAHVSRTLKSQLQTAGFAVDGDAHIISVTIGSEKRAAAISAKLFEKGLFVFPARFPTVPLNRSILRISLTALHTPDDIHALISGLKEAQYDIST